MRNKFNNSIGHLLGAIALSAFILSCDSGAIEDSVVSVSYRVSSSNGGVAGIAFMNEHNYWEGSQSSDSVWTYNFRVKESSQILYLSTSAVRDGNVRAEIYIDGTLHSSHTNTDSLRIRRSSIAWAPKTGIIGFSARGIDTSIPQVKLPSGDEIELPVYIQRNNWVWHLLQVDAVEYAPISMSISRPQVDSGSSCVELTLIYLPEGDYLGRPYYLDEVQQCTMGPVDLRVEAIIPGN